MRLVTIDRVAAKQRSGMIKIGRLHFKYTTIQRLKTVFGAGSDVKIGFFAFLDIKMASDGCHVTYQHVQHELLYILSHTNSLVESHLHTQNYKTKYLIIN